jgi:hypothetical protein
MESLLIARAHEAAVALNTGRVAGDRASAQAFWRWLARYVDRSVPVPVEPPLEVSAAGTPDAIEWWVADEELIGYSAADMTCFRIPQAALARMPLPHITSATAQGQQRPSFSGPERRRMVCGGIIGIVVASLVLLFGPRLLFGALDRIGGQLLNGSSRSGSTYRPNAPFEQPSAIAVDSSGTIYIADSGNSRIVVISSAGRTLATWNCNVRIRDRSSGRAVVVV